MNLSIIYYQTSYDFKHEAAQALNTYISVALFSINIHLSHTYIYIIKQDIRIYVPYSRPNGWTDWAEIFCGHSWLAGGCYRLKKI